MSPGVDPSRGDILETVTRIRSCVAERWNGGALLTWSASDLCELRPDPAGRD
jgi:hypothetical protein